MRNRKRRIEPLSFFNHTGISGHLEKMAAKGWMIEKIVNTGWVYRKIEPKKVHFAVSYYPKASDFDPEPSEEQKMFHDFCAHTGWQLACTSAQLQIFYNENENPIPIETEPELEVEAIHASAKKSFIPSYILFLALGFLVGCMWFSDLRRDPIGLLSDSTDLIRGITWLMLVMLSIVELTAYFRWYKKAKLAAEHGEFLKVPNTSKFQMFVLIVTAIGVIVWIVNSIFLGNSLRRWVAISMCFYMPAIFLIVNATKNFLKRKKASRGVNQTVTLITSFAVSFGLMGLITFVMLYASSHGMFADKSEETYEHRGTTLVVYQDELPLVVEDLVEVDYDGYIKQCLGEESFILGQYVMDQSPRFDAKDYAQIPQLNYSMTLVKIPAMYDWCKEHVKNERETRWGFGEEEYKVEDGTPWGANEAYRLYDPVYGAENWYLLCYDDVIVEINFDWEPTAEQMKIVGEKLQ